MSDTQKLIQDIKPFIKNLNKKGKFTINVIVNDGEIEELKIKDNMEIDTSDDDLAKQMNTSDVSSTNKTSEEIVKGIISDTSSIENGQQGGNYNFSDTSFGSINGSFLNNRIHKHSRRSMFGGGPSGNSDTLMSITELNGR